MAKGNPKVNPCKPIPRLDLGDMKKEAQRRGFNWLTWGLREIARQLFSTEKMKPRHIRKTLNISGRQLRKAVKGKRK